MTQAVGTPQAVGTLQEASPREEETLQEVVVGAIAETKTYREAGTTAVETAETQRVSRKTSLEPRPKMRQMMKPKMSLEPRPIMRQMMMLRMKPEMRRNTRLETRRKPTREFPQELSLHRSRNLTYHRTRLTISL
jgi:hypothetical protein